MVPELPDVSFARTRHIEPPLRRRLVPHWADFAAGDVRNGVTTKRRTLVDCMRMLPWDESVPIADSAIRSGDVDQAGLRRIATEMLGCGRARAIGVASLADGRTANAYESVLRALAATVPGLVAHPQAPVRTNEGRKLRPDLVDPVNRIVIEAESFAWHGDQSALTRDCVRYNDLVLAGWTVLRFSWKQVMFQPAYVLKVLTDAVRSAQRHADVA
ncbi:MAG TPA: hypothetical protein VHZ06_02595 [Marmoricola sp.]|nr:hypothetical protein [Marmoricola sp.]